MTDVMLGNVRVGDGCPAFIVGEIGINHNGNMATAKKLIDVAKAAGCGAVKFQKRTPELCVPQAQRNQMRETPWGYITYMEYRHKVEFDEAQYREIDAYCKEKEILWFASCWDNESTDLIDRLGVPCFKVASATLTQDALLQRFRSKGKPIILSTGMSTLEQVDHAVDVLGKDELVLMHSVSSYPAYYEELNLRVIQALQARYQVLVGYSGHETGIASSVAAVVLGACIVERHITLDRSMWVPTTPRR